MTDEELFEILRSIKTECFNRKSCCAEKGEKEECRFRTADGCVIDYPWCKWELETEVEE